MTNNLTPGVPADTGRVSLATPREISYWTGALACSEADLREALAATTSPRPTAVQHYLVHQRLARYPFLTPANERRA